MNICGYGRSKGSSNISKIKSCMSRLRLFAQQMKQPESCQPLRTGNSIFRLNKQEIFAPVAYPGNITWYIFHVGLFLRSFFEKASKGGIFVALLAGTKAGYVVCFAC